MLALLLMLTPVLAPQPQRDPAVTPIERLLVVEASAPGRRSPVVVDAVEAQVVRGTFAPPGAGQAVERAEGEPLVWRALEAGEDGWFEDRALRGGWGYAEVELDEPAVMILDASGHRRVYVNGVPRMGDVYGLGITELPVKLEAGTNALLFRGGRGRLRAALKPAPSGPYFLRHDRVLPDLLPEGTRAPLLIGLRLGNPTEDWVQVQVTATQKAEGRGALRLPPLSVGQMAIWGTADVGVTVEGGVTLGFAIDGDRRDASRADEFSLLVKQPREQHKRTFQSAIDGSVQYYAVTPPPAEAEGPFGFVLSLHGAGVEATNQAYSYAPKDDLVIVAPTNRRPYGFDWEDWGRMDALEVLDLERQHWELDPARTYLTGHSMGGHGTWSLGAHLPGAFAAIAPSAGWRDFWAYGTEEEPAEDPVDRLLADAASPSRTLLLKDNLLHAGVYVLHGDADETVGVEQARFLREVLGGFHPNFAYYERPGAGHWWGNECMDWPPLFGFLRQNRLPAPGEVTRVAFSTLNPAIHSRTDWIAIHAQERSLEPSRIEAELDAERGLVLVATENVAALELQRPAAWSSDGPGHTAVGVELDGETIASTWPEDRPLRFVHEEARWVEVERFDPAHKSPLRAGPFKEAFRNHFELVYGTRGDDERDAILYQQARLAAEVFAYRGNGNVRLVPDVELEVPGEPSPLFGQANLVLFGNADDNGAWQHLLGDSPVQVADGHVAVGERRLEGDDLICLLVRPFPGTSGADAASVAAVAGTGDVGARLAAVLPVFVSGVAYPDWTVIGADMLERGAAGLRAAGFFGPDWSLERGRAAWR